MEPATRASDGTPQFGGLSAVEAYERVVEGEESPEVVAADRDVDPAAVHRAVACGYDLARDEAPACDATADCPCDLESVIDAPCDGVVDAASDGIVVLDPDGTVRYANRTAERGLRDGMDPVGRNVLAALREGLGADPEAVDAFARRLRSVATGESDEARFEISTADGSSHYDLRMSALEGSTPRQVVVVGRGVTEARERERKLRERRDELERLERVSAAIESVLGAVSEASTVGEVEQALCDRLVDTDLYDVAYVGQGSATAGIEEVTATADAPPGLDERIVEGGDRDGYNPVVAAFETGECQFVEDLEEESVADSVAETSNRYGHRSGAVVPLGGKSVDRVLGIAATRSGGFSGRERMAFDTLGDVVNLAITAVRHHSLLVADTTREYEFHVPGDATWTGRLPEGCTCRIEDVVPAVGDRLVQYLTYEGAAASAVRDAIASIETILEARIESDCENAGRIRLTLPASASAAGRLADIGGRVREAVYDGDVLQFVCDAPPEVSPSQVFDALGAVYPAGDFAAQRVREGGLEAASDAPVLTDRQRAALRIARLEGFYEWPRDATAGEVADAFGVATPTLLRHLRLAHGRLASRALDDTPTDT
jgi:predicted DNA binding protein/PAS domain-containing protein